MGCRQVFVRLAGCNIFCTYCDTQESLAVSDRARIEISPGRREFCLVNNPLPVSTLIGYLVKLCQSPHHSISITGGEPLLQPQIFSALKNLKDFGVKIFLETNGTLPEVFANIVPNIDIVAMDFKLPSATQGKCYWDLHEQFLRIAAQKEVFVKVVLDAATTEEEIAKTVGMIAGVDRQIPLIYQPVSPHGMIEPVSPERVLLWQEYSLRRLKDVRVIPQTHKIMGQL